MSSSRRPAPSSDQQQRQQQQRQSRSGSNNTTQSTSSRTHRGGGGSSNNQQRGGGGLQRGGRRTVSNNENNMNINNPQGNNNNPSSNGTNNPHDFVFQHHHQHQPFFSTPWMPTTANPHQPPPAVAAATGSAPMIPSNSPGSGSATPGGVITTMQNPTNSHHHNNYPPNTNSPHQHNYPAPSPNILNGNPSSGGSHHHHHHHHLHHLMHHHQFLAAHHHHHQQHHSLSHSGGGNNNNSTSHHHHHHGGGGSSSRENNNSNSQNNNNNNNMSSNAPRDRNNNNSNSNQHRRRSSNDGRSAENNSNMNLTGPLSLPPASLQQQPSPTYILNTANRDGESQIFDFKNRPIDLATSGNLATFLNSVSPSVSTTPSHYGDGSDGESYYLIKEMLLAFRVPFGAPINMGDIGVTLSESHPPERELYYTPQLSGFKFEIRSPEPPPIHMNLGGKNNSSKQLNKKNATNLSNLEINNNPEPPQVFEWHEDAKPEMRAPLVNQFEYLTSLPEYEKLKTLKSTECTVTSWFCVLWVPIHVKTHTPQASAGSFLVFYLVNPPSNMTNSGYKKHDSNCFYFRADPYSVGPMDFMNAPRFARACDAFAPQMAPRIQKAKTSLLSSEALKRIDSGEEGEEEKQQQQQQQQQQKINDDQQGDEEEETFEEELIEEIDDPPVKMRIPIFGLIPCRISAEIWYQRFLYYTTTGPVSCYAGPLFLLYTAMQLMNWEKSRVVQQHLDRGKNIMEAHHLAAILPDYDHLMRHETRLNGFLNNYVV